MINETQFKKAWHKSVIKHGGYSVPLACPTMSGIPDLFMVMPGFHPVMMEAKWAGKCKRDKWDRKIEYTKLQELFLKECDNRAPRSAIGLIGFEYDLLIYAALFSAEHTRFKDNWKDYALAWSVFDPRNGGFNIKRMFEMLQPQPLVMELDFNASLTSMPDNPPSGSIPNGG